MHLGVIYLAPSSYFLFPENLRTYFTSNNFPSTNEGIVKP